MIAETDPELAGKTAGEITATGGTATAIVTDVRDPGQVEALKQQVLDEHGHVDVRVNAIGPDVTESIQVPYSKWVTGEQEAMWPVWVPVGRVGVPDRPDRASACRRVTGQRGWYMPASSCRRAAHQ